MRALEELLPWVLPDAPGCTDALALQRIAAAVVELCQESHVVQRMITPVDVQANVARYPINPGVTGYVLADVMWATWRGEPLEKVSPDYLDMMSPNDRRLFLDGHHVDTASGSEWRTLTSTSPELFFLEREDAVDYLRLVGMPDADSIDTPLALRVALKPSITDPEAIQLDDFLVEDFHELIAKGALSRLLAMPKKDWTDKATAELLRMQWEDGKYRVRQDTLKGFVRDDEAVMRVVAHP